MCGKKDADNGSRNSYLRVGVRQDEDGIVCTAEKKQGRRRRRFAEKRNWKEQYENDQFEEIKEVNQYIADVLDE
jgi:hypothetical protein